MSLPTLRGRIANVFGDDFDVDQIVGVRNIKVQDIDKLVALALDQFDVEFRERVRPGDFLLAGRNFGYGHPHFPAMRAMRKLGIAGVIADSFFPAYWRGEISNGFPQVACEGATKHLSRWEEIEIDFHASAIRRSANGEAVPFAPYAASELAILQAGGFKPWLTQTLAAQRQLPTGAPH